MVIQVIVQGVAMGSVYALMALGYVMIFKAVGVFNFAQGDIMMSGAFMGLVLYSIGKVPLPLMFILTLVFTALLGAVIETVAFHPLLESPSRSYLICTIAVGIILREVAKMIFGADPLLFPNYFGGHVLHAGPVAFSGDSLWIIVTGTLAVTLLLWFFSRTRLGKAMRAVAEDREVARLMGINVDANMRLTYAISSMLGGLAGILVAPAFYAFSEMGRSFGLKAFSSFVFGGTESVPGAVVGGLTIGVIESLAGVYISTQYKDVVSFVILISVLLWRPSGLFGEGREKRAG